MYPRDIINRYLVVVTMRARPTPIIPLVCSPERRNTRVSSYWGVSFLSLLWVAGNIGVRVAMDSENCAAVSFVMGVRPPWVLANSYDSIALYVQLDICISDRLIHYLDIYNVPEVS